jgi:hypothetical protein
MARRVDASSPPLWCHIDWIARLPHRTTSASALIPLALMPACHDSPKTTDLLRIPMLISTPTYPSSHPPTSRPVVSPPQHVHKRSENFHSLGPPSRDDDDHYMLCDGCTELVTSNASRGFLFVAPNMRSVCLRVTGHGRRDSDLVVCARGEGCVGGVRDRG